MLPPISPVPPRGNRRPGRGALRQVNLVSNEPGLAPLTDPDLKNPWGIAPSATSPLWVSDQDSDASTIYALGSGLEHATKSATLRVTMPGSCSGQAGKSAASSTSLRGRRTT
jgi:hypothetical protein